MGESEEKRRNHGRDVEIPCLVRSEKKKKQSSNSVESNCDNMKQSSPDFAHEALRRLNSNHNRNHNNNNNNATDFFASYNPCIVRPIDMLDDPTQALQERLQNLLIVNASSSSSSSPASSPSPSPDSSVPCCMYPLLHTHYSLFFPTSIFFSPSCNLTGVLSADPWPGRRSESMTRRGSSRNTCRGLPTSHSPSSPHRYPPHSHPYLPTCRPTYIHTYIH